MNLSSINSEVIRLKVFSTEIEMEQELNRLGQSITLKPQNEY